MILGISELSLQILYLNGSILVVCTGSSGEAYHFIGERDTARILRMSYLIHDKIEGLFKDGDASANLDPKVAQLLIRRFRRFGERLFAVVFRSEIFDLLNVAIGQAIRLDSDVVIRLMIASEFLNIIPWELLCFRGMYLCHAYDLLRHPFTLQPVRRPSAGRSGMRVLFVEANPRHNIFVKGQLDALSRALTSLAAQPDQLMSPEANYTNIASRIYDGVDVLHFLAHGELAADGSRTRSYFVIDGEGEKKEDRLPVEMLQSFCRANPMHLAVLSACRSDQAVMYKPQSPSRPEDMSYLSMAYALIQTGVPCVIGMSHPISKVGAEILARRLYRAFLDRGESLTKAMRQVRLELFAHTDDLLPSDWLTPVLYSRSPAPGLRRMDPAENPPRGPL